MFLSLLDNQCFLMMLFKLSTSDKRAGFIKDHIKNRKRCILMNL